MTLPDLLAAMFFGALLWLTEIEARKLTRADEAMRRHVNREDQGD